MTRFTRSYLALFVTSLFFFSAYLPCLFSQTGPERNRSTGQRASETGVSPLPRAHSHNDYEHDRPLHDALEQGFCSVEADIYLVEDQLLVAHNRPDVRVDRTLESLYLDPLLDRVQQHGGRVFPDGPPFHLLIDFKSEGEPTYRALRNVLQKYRDLLVKEVDGRREAGPVSITISGNRPIKLIEEDQDRLCGVDGRLTDLNTDLSADVMPLISDNWQLHFQWRGEGPIPAAEREKLEQIVSQAHERGRRVRFWATPESESLWEVLFRAEVDFINTDQLPRLRKFIVNH